MFSTSPNQDTVHENALEAEDRTASPSSTSVAVTPSNTMQAEFIEHNANSEKRHHVSEIPEGELLIGHWEIKNDRAPGVNSPYIDGTSRLQLFRKVEYYSRMAQNVKINLNILEKHGVEALEQKPELLSIVMTANGAEKDSEPEPETDMRSTFEQHAAKLQTSEHAYVDIDAMARQDQVTIDRDRFAINHIKLWEIYKFLYPEVVITHESEMFRMYRNVFAHEYGLDSKAPHVRFQTLAGLYKAFLPKIDKELAGLKKALSTFELWIDPHSVTGGPGKPIEKGVLAAIDSMTEPEGIPNVGHHVSGGSLAANDIDETSSNDWEAPAMYEDPRLPQAIRIAAAKRQFTPGWKVGLVRFFYFRRKYFRRAVHMRQKTLWHASTRAQELASAYELEWQRFQLAQNPSAKDTITDHDPVRDVVPFGVAFSNRWHSAVKKCATSLRLPRILHPSEPNVEQDPIEGTHPWGSIWNEEPIRIGEDFGNGHFEIV